MAIFLNNTKIDEYKFLIEDDFEKEIIKNSKTFFGKDSIYIETKKKLLTQTLGGVIPDGFLINFSDLDNIEFYIVEVELSKHSFSKHIWPQMTKFFAFYKIILQQRSLVDFLYGLIESNEQIKNEVKNYIGNKEIFLFLNNLIESSQNILLLIDDEKPEIEEVMQTYTEWKNFVKTIIIKKYINNNDAIYSLTPEFDEIEYAQVSEEQSTIKKESIELTEENFFKNRKTKITNVYYKLKEELLKINPNLVFNPQKYYISIRTNKNIVFIKASSKKIRVIILRDEEELRNIISQHNIKSLSGSVQKFYHASCAAVELLDEKHLDEIIDAIKPLITD